MKPVHLKTALAVALGLGLLSAPMTPAAAQGVPVVDTQNWTCPGFVPVF